MSQSAPEPTVLAALLLGAYLAGSVPCGKLVARARGIDIQAVGSGNIGATNVARTLGKRLGALVLACDALKGAAPVAIARFWLAGAPRWLVLAAGVLAVVGHCWPVWLRLRGGKGVATALGVVTVVSPLVALAALVVFALVYARWRFASLGSITAVATSVPVGWLLGEPPEHLALYGAIAALVLLTHRPNLRRLGRGREHRV